MFCVHEPSQLSTTALLDIMSKTRDPAYGIRMTKEAFCLRYGVLAPSNVRGRAITAELIASMACMEVSDCMIGKTRVFLQAPAVHLLNERVAQIRAASALQIQSWWRGNWVRERYVVTIHWIVVIQTRVRRLQAMRKLARMRSEAIINYNKTAQTARQSELDHLRVQRDYSQRALSQINERVDVLLQVIKRAFAFEYGFEETMWTNSGRMGAFYPYTMISMTMERAMTRENVFIHRTPQDVSYGAIIALRMVRYAGTNDASCNALCAAAMCLRQYGPAMVGCETIGYLLRAEGATCPKANELMEAFNKCIQTASRCFSEMMGEFFKRMLVHPTDGQARSQVVKLMETMLYSAKPAWVRNLVVEAVCHHLDTDGLDAIMACKTLRVGAQWAMQALLSLESCCREAFQSVDAAAAFPWLYQALKACQLARKDMLLDGPTRHKICPSLPPDCLARMFELYQVDADVGEMLPHNLHQRILTSGFTSSGARAHSASVSFDELEQALEDVGMTLDLISLQCSQRLPDTIARAVAKP